MNLRTLAIDRASDLVDALLRLRRHERKYNAAEHEWLRELGVLSNSAHDILDRVNKQSRSVPFASEREEDDFWNGAD